MSAEVIIMLLIQQENHLSTVSWSEILFALITAFGGLRYVDSRNWRKLDFGSTQKLCVDLSLVEITKCLTNPLLCSTLPRSSYDSWG